MDEHKSHNKIELPEDADELFKPFNDDYRHNAIIRTGKTKLFLFSDAYMTAALKLFEQLDGGAYFANTLVYPIVFICRHFLELRLKELISGLNYAKTEEFSFIMSHNLESLWKSFRELISSMDGPPIDEKTFSAVEKLICEFNSIDPQSMSFRYPINKSEEPSLKIETLDLGNFRSVMEKLFQFFYTQSDHVFYFIDMAEEYYTHMRQLYEEEMRNYY